MSSVRMRILIEAVTRLNTARPSEVPEFKLLDTLPTEADAHPSCVVYWAKERVEPATNRTSPLSQRVMRAVIEVRVGEEAPLTAMDPILVWVTSKLNGVRLSTVADPRLTQEILEQDLTLKVVPKEVPYLAVFIELEIPYTTKSSNQELVS